MGYRLRNAGVGYPTARPHRHYLLPHSTWPESIKDSFCSDAAEVDKGRAMAAMGLVVYHHHDESLQFDQGAKIRTTVPLAQIYADHLQMLFEWSRACGVKKDHELVRLDFCLHDDFLDNFKKGGNSRCPPWMARLLAPTDFLQSTT